MALVSDGWVELKYGGASKAQTMKMQTITWKHVVVKCFLTRELRACARASYRYDVGNGIRSLARSLDWSIPVNFFSILGFWVHLIVFGEQ